MTILGWLTKLCSLISRISWLKPFSSKKVRSIIFKQQISRVSSCLYIDPLTQQGIPSRSTLHLCILLRETLTLSYCFLSLSYGCWWRLLHPTGRCLFWKEWSPGEYLLRSTHFTCNVNFSSWRENCCCCCSIECFLPSFLIRVVWLLSYWIFICGRSASSLHYVFENLLKWFCFWKVATHNPGDWWWRFEYFNVIKKHCGLW